MTTQTSTIPAAAQPAVAVAAPAGSSWAHLVLSTYPQSLDPAADRSTQGAMVNWLVYTGLTTYRRASGRAGEELIAGLATSLPRVSADGKTYAFTLRSGIVYSNGTPVRAADFAYTVERAIKVYWSGAPVYLSGLIVGAQAYAQGKAKTISGITTDDSSGLIVIHLERRFASFANVLALPALGLVPTGTPMSVQSTPPPGAGPYVVQNAVAGQSFDLIINPRWDASKVPGVPAAKTNVAADVDAIVPSNGLSMLDNSSDLTDPTDMFPASELREMQRLGANRTRTVNFGLTTDLIFMNTRRAPFNSLLARKAVITALSHAQFVASSSGAASLMAGCYLLPPALATSARPAGCPDGAQSGDIAKAKRLIAASGERGQKVTVYTPTRSPYALWMAYYAGVLNEIGLKATVQQEPDSDYQTVIGEAKSVNPQTGVLSWRASFPNAADFFSQLLDSASLHSWGNLNLSQVDNPTLDKLIAQAAATSAGSGAGANAAWRTLDSYVAKQAYFAVIGYPVSTYATSEHVAWNATILSALYGWNLSAIGLGG